MNTTQWVSKIVKTLSRPDNSLYTRLYCLYRYTI